MKPNLFVVSKSQSISLGSIATVQVLAIRKGNVKLGVIADKSVPVLKGEVLEQLIRSHNNLSEHRLMG